jgi:5'-methylthioadenosine phosphorylase
MIGVFGGSGFYEFLDEVEHIEVETPFGPPSAPIALGTASRRRVAFLPRHGVEHALMPHLVPVKANLWAFRQLGVRQVIGPCAAGSLRSDVHPGEFVVLDQLVDRTCGRPLTFHDGGGAHHVSFADPYCPEMSRLAVEAGGKLGVRMHPGGTVVVIQGPRFSTRAESRWYRAQGWDVVNMTQYPEAYLARELGMHYCGIALVTDYDAGLDDDPTVAPVAMDDVFDVLARNVERVRALLLELIPMLPEDPPGYPDAVGSFDGLE